MGWKLASRPCHGLSRVSLLCAILTCGVAVGHAQALSSGRANQGISLYESFQGSESSSGSVFNVNNTFGYDFSSQLGIDFTVPIYFAQPPAQQSGFAASAKGIGNVSVDGRLSLDLLLVDYSPTVTLAFPTGNTTSGFSTGSTTYDFDNHFDHEFGLITPFFDVDVGNSLNNGSSPTRTVIERPYLTLGKVANFMIGPEVHLTDRLTLSADVYKVVPWGPQTVFSRVVRAGTTGKGGAKNRTYEIVQKQVGGAKLVDDDGFDASVAFSPTHFMDLTLAFDHSMHYDLNTVSFSVGFNMSQLFSRKPF